MANKRKAQNAFVKSASNGMMVSALTYRTIAYLLNRVGQLSAFAAARLAKQSKPSSVPLPGSFIDGQDAILTATLVGAVPYDCHIDANPSAVTTANIQSTNELARPQALLSSFDAESIIRDDNDCFEVALQPGQTVTVVGEYDLEVLKGSISIYGASLRPSGTIPGTDEPIPGSGKHRVWAPSTYSLPQIAARRDGALIQITSTRSPIDKLGKLSPLFRNISAGSSERSFAVLRTAQDDPLQRSLGLLEGGRETSELVATLLSKTEASGLQYILVLGAKSAGKSTFTRLICNAFTTMTAGNRCLYLDLDPGQPEFGPPGQVSLVEVTVPILGPPFSHSATTNSLDFRLLRSHTIAATTYKDDPGHYLRCVKDLVQHVHRQDPGNVSIIINSCGWVNGLGANITMETISVLNRCNLDIVILEPVDGSLIDSLHTSCSSARFHRLPRRHPRPSARTPAEVRTMHTMAYFHHRHDQGISHSKWLGKPICSWRPYTISYDHADSIIFAVMSYGPFLNPAFLAEVLEGSIVAVVKAQDRAFDAEASRHNVHRRPSIGDEARGEYPQYTSEGIPYISQTSCGPLDPMYSESVGLALVRGIDVEGKKLHLVTPVPRAQLEAGKDERIVLVRGAFDPPGWAYLEDLYLDGDADRNGIEDRPWVSGKEMAGIEGAVWRLRHPPMASAVVASRQ